MHQAIFKLAGTRQKRRFGDDAASEHVSLALLSTTNSPLLELVSGSPEVKGALQSRMLTVRADGGRPYGVFDSIPDGCGSARDAIERLRAAANEHYGVAGRAFLERLVREAAENEEILRRNIARRLDHYVRAVTASGVGSARLQKSLALAAAAGRLAKTFGVLPKQWRASLRKVASCVISEGPAARDPQRGALDRVHAYIERHRTDLIIASNLEAPCSPEKFANAPGFLTRRGDRMELLVAATRFQSEFPDFRVLMRELRDARLARTEGGTKPKLTIKAPRSICETGRAYCIYLR
jgi:hypothetical protein